MDLMRRDAAGELAALLGAAAIPHDRNRRIHRMRQTAKQVVAQATEAEQKVLAAYTEGVNAGLGALPVRPFEYLLLRSLPEPWRREDSILTIFAMYFQLNDEDGVRDRTVARLHDALSPALFRFLTVAGTDWDAPLIGETIEVPPVPGPDACDLREGRTARRPAAREWRPLVEDEGEVIVGSNGWAVAASHSASGRAILADDMHLGLRVPNTWYRARLVVTDAEHPERNVDVTGVTLPGTPVVAAGSNRHVAWGFTNSRGDWVDLVLLEVDPNDPDSYRTPDGYRRFEDSEEQIVVRGGDPVILPVRSTIWGPVVGKDHRGRWQALRWQAHEPEATNIRILDLEHARNVRDAISVAHRAGIPPQNFIVADAHGSIAWTIIGHIPLRHGYDTRLPVSWADGKRGWHGWLPADRYPVIVNPPQGRIWTANVRVADGAMVERIGDGGYSLGARAGQIRDGLRARDKATIADMLQVQLDDRSGLHQRWQALLLDVLTPETASGNLRRAALRRALEQWDGRATVDSVGYRMVREFRSWLHDELISGITSGCGKIEMQISNKRMHQLEGPLWRLVTERPAHLLPSRFHSWEALFVSAVDGALAACAHENVSECTWGDVNTVTIAHPLTRALPALARWLNVHDGPLPGGAYTPRVQRGAWGASERFAVSPGNEANGYFHMPRGQSGHPLSRFYRAGHEAWVTGEPTPFLPGATKFSLTLHPRRS